MKIEAKRRLLGAETSKHYERRLQRSGIKELGRGSYAIVYQHPTKRKLVVRLAWKDMANKAWIKFCQQHPTNPYLPHIDWAKPIDLDDKPSAYAVCMEKLEPLVTNSDETRDEFQLFTCTLDSDFRYDLNMGRGHKITRLKEINTREFWGNLAAKPDVDAHLREVATWLGSFRGLLDIGASNFMKRGSQVVFVDPVRFQKTAADY